MLGALRYLFLTRPRLYNLRLIYYKAQLNSKDSPFEIVGPSYNPTYFTVLMLFSGMFVKHLRTNKIFKKG